MARPNWCRMSSLRLTEPRVARGSGVVGAPGFSSTRILGVACLTLLIAACSGSPRVPDDRESAAASASPAGRSAGEESGSAKTAGVPNPVTATPGSGSGASAPPPDLPPRALADFQRAVGLMRSGNAGEAELEFKQLALGYPQLVGAQVNLALLQRKADRLEEAENTLKAAVEKSPGSAMAWNELGVTQRMRGRFQEAAASYQQALAADDNYAAAHRNYGVLLDLYIQDPERALTEFERYQELTGEDKPVSGWIAELRRRTGKPATPPKPAAPADAAPGAAPEGAEPSEAPASAEAPPARAHVPVEFPTLLVASASSTVTRLQEHSGKGA